MSPKEQVAALKDQRRAITREIRKVRRAACAEAFAAMSPPRKPKRLKYLAFDTSWGCDKAPTGECVYDEYMDACHDDCLFCHKPQERL